VKLLASFLCLMLLQNLTQVRGQSNSFCIDNIGMRSRIASAQKILAFLFKRSIDRLTTRSITGTMVMIGNMWKKKGLQRSSGKGTKEQ